MNGGKYDEKQTTEVFIVFFVCLSSVTIHSLYATVDRTNVWVLGGYSMYVDPYAAVIAVNVSESINV